jgi:hypothetical protein
METPAKTGTTEHRSTCAHPTTLAVLLSPETQTTKGWERDSLYGTERESCATNKTKPGGNRTRGGAFDGVAAEGGKLGTVCAIWRGPTPSYRV